MIIDNAFAALGDAYANFICAGTLTQEQEARGRKTEGALLVEASRRSGLRKHLPSGIGSHDIVDAEEVLIVYAWLTKTIVIEDTMSILEKKMTRQKL
jgi:hypothetical protein